MKNDIPVYAVIDKIIPYLIYIKHFLSDCFIYKSEASNIRDIICNSGYKYVSVRTYIYVYVINMLVGAFHIKFISVTLVQNLVRFLYRLFLYIRMSQWYHSPSYSSKIRVDTSL